MEYDTSKTIIINTATIKDAPAIHQLVMECKTLDLNSRYLYLLLCTHFDSYTLTAKTPGGSLAGFVSSYPHPKMKNTLFIWQVGVSSNHRKQGIASRLLNTLISNAVLSNIKYIEATVTPSNRASFNLFVKIANNLQAKLHSEPLFEKSLLPENHEEEWLIRIGPIQKQKEL